MIIEIKGTSQFRYQVTFGATRALIYDLKDNKAFHLNPMAAKLVREILFLQKVPDFIRNSHPSFYTKLFEYQFVLEKGILNQEQVQFESIPASPLKKIWVELTNKCNQTCLHCYASSSPYSPDGLESSHIYHFLETAFSKGCESVQFTGGEPMIRKDIVSFLALARQFGVKEIELFSNLSITNKPALDEIIKSNVLVSTTILAPDAFTHDKLTQSPGSFNRMLSNIRYLQNAGVSVNSSIILMAETEGRYQEIHDFCVELGVYFGEPDSVRPFGRGINTEIQCKEYKNTRDKPSFQTTPRMSIYSQYFNQCWGHMLFLRYDGVVVPCPHARDYILGNIFSDLFDEILENAHHRAWTITFDMIDTCKECEFRYICNDCRPLAYETNISNLYVKNTRCLYNPYSGEWKSNNL